MSKIKHSKVVFPDRTHYKIDYSDELVDLVTKLLKKDRTQRLGAKNDAKEVLDHPWFKDLDLVALFKLELEPPFIPEYENEG